MELGEISVVEYIFTVQGTRKSVLEIKSLIKENWKTKLMEKLCSVVFIVSKISPYDCVKKKM